MAAIDGFDATVATGDAVVTHGMVNGTAVAGATLDANTLDDGQALIVVVAAGTLALKNAADRLATDTVVGSATVASDLVTAVSYARRGESFPVSANS